MLISTQIYLSGMLMEKILCNYNNLCCMDMHVVGVSGYKWVRDKNFIKT